MKYRMYVDECGNPDLESSDNPIHRFLSLTGVIIELDYVSSPLYGQIESLKSKYFGSHPDDPIILHRKEIVNAKYPFELLRDKKIRKQFDIELLDFLKTWEYTVVTVCLDKQSHKETYQVWRYEPYHYCLAILLERYAMFLEQRHAQGDVMAESRGGKEDRKLKDSFSRIWKDGTEYVTPERFQKVLSSLASNSRLSQRQTTYRVYKSQILLPIQVELRFFLKTANEKPNLLHLLKRWWSFLKGNIISTKERFSERSSYKKKGPKRARWLFAIHLQ